MVILFYHCGQKIEEKKSVELKPFLYIITITR